MLGMRHFLLMIAVVAFSLCLPLGGADKKLLNKKETAKIIETAIRKELNKPKGELTKADLGKVTRLDLSFTKITDASLNELAKLNNLAELGLAGTQITDTGLKEVAKLKQLKMLNLGSTTSVTEASVVQLQKALPNCRISHTAKK